MTTYKKMDPAVKAKWVKALRSGRYKQGTGQLINTKDFDKPHYCCLGVVTKCARLGTPNENYDGFEFTGTYAENGELPEIVRERIGLSSNAQNQLIRFNDGTDGGQDPTATPHRDFNFIADWIEKNL